jgi:hypothetical protein
MRHSSSVVLILALAGSALSAQTPPPKPPVARKPVAPASRDLGQRLLDTALTAAASAVADSLLGKNAAGVAGVMAMMGANGMPTCAAGLIPYPSPAMAAAGNAATAAAVAAVAAATGTTTPTAGAMAGLLPGASAGTAIVDAAKKKLVKAPMVPGVPQFLCGTPAQATAAMQSMVNGAQALQAAQVAGMTPAAQAQLAQLGQATQLAQAAQAAQAGQVAQAGRAAQIAQAAQAVTGAAGAGGAQGGMPTVGSMLAATPQGMMVNAAAPLAGAAAKKFSGMLKGSQSKEAMAADLAKGKLILKGVKFVEGTDMFSTEPEGEIAALVEAIKAVDGQFILNVPAESDGKSPPEVSMAQRRLGKITAMLVAGGITDDRITTHGVQPPGLDPKASAPKPGAGRPELIRVPKEAKP